MKDTICILEALAQQTRLEALELLLQHESEGLSSGDVARALSVPPNTMSTHLNKLNQAGLVYAERHSRNIIYRADRDHLVISLLKLVDHYSVGNQRGRCK
ncbi:ArsR/SmtB family transcription factor [Rhizobium binxianense]|uniref:ArsR/SmtB family transcription factor n=1 Tax=Rhizobium binxianense TaxID=3024242 RepID=UPI00235EC2E9|nr:metalloregulator ArsR/SmtB family transcription factor [Rhizobium sp. MJ37]MDC9834945.1 metalloregulator ArsR/SmtB family transcription factor [Rhizobium sp. MJ37]